MTVPNLYNGIEPEWTEENMFKEFGDTTFKKCGWCEYTTSGIVKHNCLLRSNCGLMDKNSPEVDWNDDCKYKKLSVKEKLRIINNKLYDIGVCGNRIKREEEHIYVILKEINKE